VFAPAAVLFLVDLVGDVIPAASSSLETLSLGGVTIGLSVQLFLSAAAHVLCLAWLIRVLAEARLGKRLDLASLVPAVFVVLALGMAVLFVSLGLFIWAASEFIFLALIVWGGGLFWFNSRLVPFLAALPLAAGGPRAIWAKTNELFRARPSAWYRTVAVHLLVLGFATLVWLDGYTTRTAEGFHVWNTTNYAVHGQILLTLPLDSAWLTAIAEAIKTDVPTAVSLGGEAVMVLLGTVFTASYAVTGFELAAKRGDEEAGGLA
jgi:hypothetical protein